MAEDLEPKRKRDLHVYMCVICSSYAEYPGSCKFCGSTIIGKPIDIRLAQLNSIQSMNFKLDKLIEKLKK